MLRWGEEGRTDCERLGGEAGLGCCVIGEHAVAGAALVHKGDGVAAAPALAQRGTVSSSVLVSYSHIPV